MQVSEKSRAIGEKTVENSVENCGKIVRKIRVKYFIFVRREFFTENCFSAFCKSL